VGIHRSVKYLQIQGINLLSRLESYEVNYGIDIMDLFPQLTPLLMKISTPTITGIGISGVSNNG